MVTIEGLIETLNCGETCACSLEANAAAIRTISAVAVGTVRGMNSPLHVSTLGQSWNGHRGENCKAIWRNLARVEGSKAESWAATHGKPSTRFDQTGFLPIAVIHPLPDSVASFT